MQRRSTPKAAATSGGRAPTPSSTQIRTSGGWIRREVAGATPTGDEHDDLGDLFFEAEEKGEKEEEGGGRSEEERVTAGYRRKQGWQIRARDRRIRPRQSQSRAVPAASDRPAPQRRTRAGPAEVPVAAFLAATGLPVACSGDGEVWVEWEAVA